MKTIAGLRKSHFVARAKTDFAFTFATVAYDLMCLPRLLAGAT